MQEICVFCFINRRLQIFVDIHNLWPKVQQYFTGLSHAMFSYRNYGRAVVFWFFFFLASINLLQIYQVLYNN